MKSVITVCLRLSDKKFLIIACILLALAFSTVAKAQSLTLDCPGTPTSDYRDIDLSKCILSLQNSETYDSIEMTPVNRFPNPANNTGANNSPPYGTNIFPKIILNGYTLVIAPYGSLEINPDYTTSAYTGSTKAFSIVTTEDLGTLTTAPGGLVISEGATFSYNANAANGQNRPIIRLDVLDLYGTWNMAGRTYNGTSSNANSNQYDHIRINNLIMHPGSLINLKGTTFLTYDNVPNTGQTLTGTNIALYSTNYSTLKKLDLYGIGGDGTISTNTVTYKPEPDSGTSSLSKNLHTNELAVHLMDSGMFGAETVLLNFDTTGLTGTYLQTSGLTVPSLAGSGDPYKRIMYLTVDVTDANGKTSKLKEEQPIGETFVIVSKISPYCLNATAGCGDTTPAMLQQKMQRQLSQFNQEFKLDAGPYLDIVLGTFLDESKGWNDLSLKGQWLGYSADKSIPLLEGMLANAVVLNNSFDLLTETGIGNALNVTDPRYGERGFGIFTAFETYSQKVTTGSHIEAKGFNFVGGPSINYDTRFGHLLVGGFLEIGSADYDTATTYKISEGKLRKPVGTYDVLGGGKSEYIGGGILLRHDFRQGWYGEASVKAGRYRNEFSSTDMGPEVQFNAKSNYIGLHAGLGNRFEYQPRLMMDVYGKVYWMKLGGDRIITKDGMPVDFEDSEYLRTRVGIRYTYQLADYIGINAGGYWNYNFGGPRFGSVAGRVGKSQTPIAPDHEPSLEGSSGALELGLEYKPLADIGLSLALTGKAFLGKVEGGSGTLSLKYVFGGNHYGSENSPGDSSRGAFIPPSAGNSYGPLYSSPGIQTGNQRRSILMAQADVNDPESYEEDEDPSNSTLSTITVYAEPQWKQVLSPGTVSVVTPDDYRGEQKSLGELLDIVPGLHVNRRGGSGQYTTVNVRGSTAAQVAVYVDGVPQNLGGDAAADISLYTSENVARVEVYKGYVPVRFAGAPIGGVINIVTKKPGAQSTTLSVGSRSYGGFKANGLFTSPLFGGSMLFSATRDQSRGDFRYKFWQNQLMTDVSRGITDRRRMHNSHQKTDVMGKWQTERLFLQASWKEMERYYPWSTNIIGQGNNAGLVDIDGDPWGVNRRNKQTVIDRDLTIGFRNDIGDLNFGAEINYRKQSKRFEWIDGPLDKAQRTSQGESPGDVWNTYETNRVGLVLDASYKIGDNNMLEFRANFGRERLSMNGNDWTSPKVDSLRTVSMATFYEQKSTNLQLQDTITVDDDLWVTLILRTERVQATGIDLSTVYSSGFGYDIVTPSAYSKGFPNDDAKWNSTWGIAIKNNVNDNWTLKATGGTFIRYPNFYELFGDGVYIKPAIFEFYTVPPPEPEEGEQWDFTVEWNGDVPWLDIKGDLSATYFYRRTENMIGLYQTPTFVYYGNYGLTKASGVEMEGGVKSQYVDFRFSVTWLESKIIDVSDASGNVKYSQWFSEGSEMLNSPKWETNVRGDFRVPWVDGLSIFAEHHYTSKLPIQYIGFDSLRYEESLETVNMGLKANITDNLQLVAGVNDVFNKSSSQGAFNKYNYKTPGDSPETFTLYFPKEGRTSYVTLTLTF
jgi:outer membrane receptor protein involved in Fe transport